MNPEELLTHYDFIRSLSRGLVADVNHAEDIEQQTWLAALENPPSIGRPIRYWLSKVALNFVRRLHRAEKSRKKHENASGGIESATPPDQIVEREEIRHCLIDAVLNLKDPYRTAILLRYYDGFQPREIAKRLDIPVDRVWTHLKRGLAQLRQKLDAQHGGDRNKWLIAVAPIAGLKMTSSAGAAAGTGAAVAGVVAMSTKLKLTITAACVLVATLVVLHLLPESPKDDNPSVPITEVGDPEIQDNGYTEAQSDAEKTASTLSGKGEQKRTPLNPKGTFISGKVVNKITGEPVKAYDFTLNPAYPRKSGDNIHETVFDENGKYYYPLQEAGRYHICIRSSCHIEKDVFIEVPRETGLSGVEVALDPGLSVSGKVVEARTGRPVTNALVVPVTHDNDFAGVEQYRMGYQEFCVHSVTDATGHFTMRGLEETKTKIVALHQEYAQGWIEINSFDIENTGLEIGLRPGHSIFGKIYSDHGKPLAGVQVHMYGYNFPLPRRYTTNQDGMYRTEFSLPGQLHLNAKPPWGDAGKSFDFTKESKVVVLENFNLEVNFGLTDEYVTWLGTIYDSEGSPCVGGWLRFEADSSFPWIFDSNGLYSCGRRLDETGSFEFIKVPPGRYIVNLTLGEARREIEWGLITFDRPGIVERDIYVSGAVVSGIVINGYTGEPLREGYVNADSEKPGSYDYACEIKKDGSFQLTGVSPGIYNLVGGRSKHVRGYLDGIKIEKGQIISGLRIVTPVQGQVSIKITGFNDPEQRRYKYYFLRTDEPSYSYGGTTTGVGKDGADEIKEFLKVGKWTITLAYPTSKGKGYIERTFEVHADSITELTISREDLTFFEGTFTVEGTLTLWDGSPVSDAEIIFEVTSFSNLEIPASKKLLGKARTNEAGRFELEGFKPGRWCVSIVIPEAGMIHLPNIVLPTDAMNPYPLDLVLPQAMVSGTFCHAKTSKPIDDVKLSWKLTLHTIEPRWSPKIREVVGHANDPFQLRHVPQGRYVLNADVLGCVTYQSEPFSISDGQYLDLGTINLKSCGVAILDIVDDQNEPVEYFDFYVNGKQLYDDEASLEKLPDGRRRYNNLPMGDVEIKIQAEGYKEQKIIIHLEPGKPSSSRVVMQGE